MRSTDRTVYAATAERVWAALSDWRRYLDWMPDVTWVRLQGPERTVGLELLVRTKLLGLPLVTDRMVVTAWEPPRRLGILHQGVVKGPAEWLLESAGDGASTAFVWTEELRMAPPVLGELALRAYWPWQRRMFRRSMENLRRLVEIPAS